MYLNLRGRSFRSFSWSWETTPQTARQCVILTIILVLSAPMLALFQSVTPLWNWYIAIKFITLSCCKNTQGEKCRRSRLLQIGGGACKWGTSHSKIFQFTWVLISMSFCNAKFAVYQSICRKLWHSWPLIFHCTNKRTMGYDITCQKSKSSNGPIFTERTQIS